MAARLDPRAWNLLAGFGLVAGACSGRTIGSDDTGNADTGNADTNESGVSSETQGTSNPETSSETDPDSSTESESDDSQCNQNSDCPPGYYCVGGMCEYYEAPDGGPWYECYESNECEALSLCVYDSCESVSALPDCAANSESSIPLAVDDAPLALSFVDLDADGAAELVVATPSELHVFESGSNIATVSARVYESLVVTAMVAGEFDPSPGQDLTLLVEDSLLLHPSDGIAGFDSPSESASPQLDSAGMLAGDFDGMPPSDHLVWGNNGASVIAGTESTLHNGPVLAATAADLSSDSGRFVMLTSQWMWIYGLDGSELAEFGLDGFSDVGFLVSIVENTESRDLVASVHETWTMLEQRELQQSLQRSGVNGAASAMVGADLDGDGNDEVALILDAGVTLLDALESFDGCTQALELGDLTGATHLAAGDWDGDGDDELAVAFSNGELAVFDEG